MDKVKQAYLGIHGDALGVDHAKIMKDHGPALRKKDNEFKEILAKAREAQTQETE